MSLPSPEDMRDWPQSVQGWSQIFAALQPQSQGLYACHIIRARAEQDKDFRDTAKMVQDQMVLLASADVPTFLEALCSKQESAWQDFMEATWRSVTEEGRRATSAGRRFVSHGRPESRAIGAASEATASRSHTPGAASSSGAGPSATAPAGRASRVWQAPSTPRAPSDAPAKAAAPRPSSRPLPVREDWTGWNRTTRPRAPPAPAWRPSLHPGQAAPRAGQPAYRDCRGDNVESVHIEQQGGDTIRTVRPARRTPGSSSQGGSAPPTSRSRTPPAPKAVVMRRPATGGTSRDVQADSHLLMSDADDDTNFLEIQAASDTYTAHGLQTLQALDARAQDEAVARRLQDQEFRRAKAAARRHDQIIPKSRNRDGKGGKSEGKGEGNRDQSSDHSAGPGSQGPRSGRRGGGGRGGGGAYAAVLGSLPGTAGAVRDTCQAVARPLPRTGLPWGVIACLLWALCLLIWVCWLLWPVFRRRWRIQFCCRRRIIMQDASTQAGLPAMMDAATQAAGPPQAWAPLGQDLYWTASGACDLHWHTRWDCEGLNGARHRVQRHNACSYCALR